jgi:hypothetical protein
MRAQAMAASVFLEGGWLNPDLGDAYERGADLALTFHTTSAAPERAPGGWGSLCPALPSGMLLLSLHIPEL